MEKNLTTGSVGRQLIGFSLPYLLSYLLQTLYGMADLFIIGQYEGVAGTTAVAVGSQVMYMLTVMIVGLAMGTTVSIARAIGADDRPQAAAATGNTVTLFLSLSLVLTVGLLLLRRPITAVGIMEKIIGFLFLVPSSMLSAVSALESRSGRSRPCSGPSAWPAGLERSRSLRCSFLPRRWWACSRRTRRRCWPGDSICAGTSGTASLPGCSSASAAISAPAGGGFLAVRRHVPRAGRGGSGDRRADLSAGLRVRPRALWR